MKKLSLAVIMAFLIALTALPVFADSERVVTLGANLTMDEQQKMLRYFGAGENVRIIYVTNEEERAFLSDYIPLSVIGTRTLSCAYVKPTNSGGIQVKTANLNWVTSNMIAAALSTAGVKNCEVIAACPREVSGTGALAGVLKAYETASASVLDPARKVIAAQEIATVSSLAENVGQNQATQIINEVKIEIIEDEVDELDESLIEDIVEEVLARNEEENNIQVTEELKESIEELAKQIAAQNYNYEDVKETLDRVEQNVTNNNTNNNNPEINININNTQNNDNSNTANNDTASTDNTASADSNAANDDAALAEDSILTNTNDDALGENVIVDATTVLPEENEPAQEVGTEAPAAEAEGGAEFEITTSDEAVITDGEPAPQEDGAAAEPAAEVPADGGETGDSDLGIPEAQTEVFSEDAPAEDFGETDTEEDLFEGSSDDALIEDTTDDVPDESADAISEDTAEDEAAAEDAAPAEDAAEEKKAVIEEKFNSNAIKVFSTFKPESVSFSYTYPGDEPGEVKKVEKPVILEVKEENLTEQAKGIGAKYAIYIPTEEITMDCNVTVNLDDVTESRDLKYVPSTITVSEESKGVYTVTTTMMEGAVSSVVSVNPGAPAMIDDDMFLRFTEDGEATLTVTYYNDAQEEIGSDTLVVASVKEG